MIEEVRDNLKLPKKKWLIPAIGIVGLLGLYALFRGGGSGETVAISEGYPAPAMKGETESNRAMLEELALYMERLDEAIGKNAENITGLDTKYSESINQTQESLNNSLSVVLDKVTDLEGLTQAPAPIISQGKSTPAYGWGYEPTNEQIKANNQKIASDSNYRQSEIDRANQVIANRKRAGMDTTAQERYLKQITS